MVQQFKARFANGVLTPLLPLDFEEGEIILLHIGPPPPPGELPKPVIADPDPKALKRFLEEEDIEHYLRVLNQDKTQ